MWIQPEREVDYDEMKPAPQLRKTKAGQTVTLSHGEGLQNGAYHVALGSGVWEI